MKLYEGVIMGVAVWLACDYALKEWGTQPIVQLTFPDGKCIEVFSPDPEHTCTNRPKIYSVEWVSPKYKRN